LHGSQQFLLFFCREESSDLGGFSPECACLP